MNDDPYRDPVLYDLEYAGHTLDIAWYRALAGGLGGPILELGCGTGRIAIPLLLDGHEVTGVDRSKPMLEQLIARIHQQPPDVQARATVHQADFLTLDLDRRFPLVLLPFNALHHCADEAQVAQLFRVVRRHMRDNAVFALDCYLPDPALYSRDPSLRYEERTFTRPDTHETLVSWERSWYDAPNALHHVQYIYRRADGTEHTVQLDLKMWSHAQLHRMIADAGFAVLRELADFEGAPMGPGALQSVLVLKSR